MTSDADREALAEFSTRRGAAYRMVIAHKDDISRWLDEGWSIVAIYRLLRSKKIITSKYESFRMAVNKVIYNKHNRKTVLDNKNHDVSNDDVKQNAKLQRKRPHEIQRNKQQQFVTISGVDHIGLDKKEE